MMYIYIYIYYFAAELIGCVSQVNGCSPSFSYWFQLVQVKTASSKNIVYYSIRSPKARETCLIDPCHVTVIGFLLKTGLR